MGLGEEYHKRWCVLIASNQGDVASAWHSTIDVNLHHLFKVGSAKYSKVIIFPFPYSLLCKIINKSSPHSRGEELSYTFWIGKYLHILFELFCKEDFSSFPTCLFNYLLISIWTHAYFFNFVLLFNMTLLTLLLTLIQLGHWKLFQVRSCVLLTDPYIYILLALPCFGVQDAIGSFMSQPSIQPFSQWILSPFIWEWYLVTKIWTLSMDCFAVCSSSEMKTQGCRK